MINYDRSRQSMLSVPERWGELYFALFGIMCAVGETFVICYAIISRQPDENALDVAAAILLRRVAGAPNHASEGLGNEDVGNVQA